MSHLSLTIGLAVLFAGLLYVVAGGHLSVQTGAGAGAAPFSFAMSTGSISLPAPLGGTLFPWMANPVVPAETASPFKGEPVTKPRTMDDPGRKLDDALVARTQAGDAAAFDELS